MTRFQLRVDPPRRRRSILWQGTSRKEAEKQFDDEAERLYESNYEGPRETVELIEFGPGIPSFGKTLRTYGSSSHGPPRYFGRWMTEYAYGDRREHRSTRQNTPFVVWKDQMIRDLEEAGPGPLGPRASERELLALFRAGLTPRQAAHALHGRYADRRPGRSGKFLGHVGRWLGLGGIELTEPGVAVETKGAKVLLVAGNEYNLKFVAPASWGADTHRVMAAGNRWLFWQGLRSRLWHCREVGYVGAFACSTNVTAPRNKTLVIGTVANDLTLVEVARSITDPKLRQRSGDRTRRQARRR